MRGCSEEVAKRGFVGRLAVQVGLKESVLKIENHLREDLTVFHSPLPSPAGFGRQWRTLHVSAMDKLPIQGGEDGALVTVQVYRQGGYYTLYWQRHLRAGGEYKLIVRPERLTDRYFTEERLQHEWGAAPEMPSQEVLDRLAEAPKSPVSTMRSLSPTPGWFGRRSASPPPDRTGNTTESSPMAPPRRQGSGNVNRSPPAPTRQPTGNNMPDAQYSREDSSRSLGSRISSSPEGSMVNDPSYASSSYRGSPESIGSMRPPSRQNSGNMALNRSSESAGDQRGRHFAADVEAGRTPAGDNRGRSPAGDRGRTADRGQSPANDANGTKSPKKRSLSPIACLIPSAVSMFRRAGSSGANMQLQPPPQPPTLSSQPATQLSSARSSLHPTVGTVPDTDRSDDADIMGHLQFEAEEYGTHRQRDIVQPVAARPPDPVRTQRSPEHHMRNSQQHHMQNTHQPTPYAAVPSLQYSDEEERPYQPPPRQHSFKSNEERPEVPSRTRALPQSVPLSAAAPAILSPRSPMSIHDNLLSPRSFDYYSTSHPAEVDDDEEVEALPSLHLRMNISAPTLSSSVQVEKARQHGFAPRSSTLQVVIGASQPSQGYAAPVSSSVQERKPRHVNHVSPQNQPALNALPSPNCASRNNLSIAQALPAPAVLLSSPLSSDQEDMAAMRSRRDYDAPMSASVQEVKPRAPPMSASVQEVKPRPPPISSSVQHVKPRQASPEPDNPLMQFMLSGPARPPNLSPTAAVKLPQSPKSPKGVLKHQSAYGASGPASQLSKASQGDLRLDLDNESRFERNLSGILKQNTNPIESDGEKLDAISITRSLSASKNIRWADDLHESYENSPRNSIISLELNDTDDILSGKHRTGLPPRSGKRLNEEPASSASSLSKARDLQPNPLDLLEDLLVESNAHSTPFPTYPAPVFSPDASTGTMRRSNSDLQQSLRSHPPPGSYSPTGTLQKTKSESALIRDNGSICQRCGSTVVNGQPRFLSTQGHFYHPQCSRDLGIPGQYQT